VEQIVEEAVHIHAGFRIDDKQRHAQVGSNALASLNTRLGLKKRESAQCGGLR
jgi:hypothetical protein